MLIRRNITRKLELSPDRDQCLVSQGHTARAIWNLLHEFMTGNSKGRRPTLKQADAAIRQGRHEIEWLGELSAQAAQAVLKTYKQAWENFFKYGAGAPKYKSRYHDKLAVDVPQASPLHIQRISRHYALVSIPKVGRVKFRWSGPIPGVGREPGRVTGARLVKGAFGWEIIFRCEVEMPDPAMHGGPTTGVDRGIAVSLALSDSAGDKTHGPWLSPKESERFLRLQRKAARQKRRATHGQPTSHRLQRTYDQIAKAHATTKRRRRNWQHQVTTELARTYAIIGVEDLKLANMTRSAAGTIENPGTNVAQKRGLNRTLLNEGHGDTISLLTYKCEQLGGLVVPVPAPGTSQTCSRCGRRDPRSRKDQQFTCTRCGFSCHADTNAARIIEDRALALVLEALLIAGVPSEFSSL